MQGIREDLVSKIHELASEHAVVLDRIAKIEESRDKVKESVYLKVLQDYQVRLQAVVDQLSPLCSELLTALENSLGSEQSQNTQKLEEQLEEIELRIALGEYDETQGRLQAEQINAMIRAGEQSRLILNSMQCALGEVRETLVSLLPALGTYFGSFQAPATVPSAAPSTTPVQEPLPPASPGSPSTSAILQAEELSLLDRLDSSVLKVDDADEDELIRRADSFLSGGSDSQVDIDDLDSLDMDEMGFGGEHYQTPPYGRETVQGRDHSSGELNLSEMGMKPSSDREFQEDMTMKTPFIGEMASQTPPRPMPVVSAGPPVLIMKNSMGVTENQFNLTAQETAIGRAQDNDIVLLDKTVSRHHALISREDRGYVIVDLNSTKGTFVNGQRVEQKVLMGNDRILIGTITFVFNDTSY